MPEERTVVFRLLVGCHKGMQSLEHTMIVLLVTMTITIIGGGAPHRPSTPAPPSPRLPDLPDSGLVASPIHCMITRQPASQQPARQAQGPREGLRSPRLQ